MTTRLDSNSSSAIGRRGRRLCTISALALLSAGSAMAQTPLEQCATVAKDKGELVACLDRRLKDANMRLNTALKAAQQRIEQLERENRRPGMSNFIDSQRKFNAYRDTNCTWHSVQAPQANRGEEFVKDCQIRATLTRVQELMVFAHGEESTAAAAMTDSPATPTEPAPPPRREKREPPAPTVVEEDGAEVLVVPPDEFETPQEQAATAPEVLPPEDRPVTQPPAEPRRPAQWRLIKWVERGRERDLPPDSEIRVQLNPSGRIEGQGPVNAFSGEYRFNEQGQLVWGGGFEVEKQAGPPALLKQEQAFLRALRRTRRYQVDQGELMLESADKSVVLTFTK